LDSGDERDTNANKKSKEDDLDIEDSLKITVYMHIQSPSPPLRQGSTRSKAKIDTAPVAIRDPCFFQSHETYDGFMRIIAKELPCKPKLLPTKDISWKYEKPANDPKKPLLNAAGFEAMLMSLKERRGNHVIVIFMPLPKADDTVSVSAT
jgi:hypothetical protein